MHFEKVTVYDPKDPSTSGVAWLRCPTESHKRQFSKAGKGDVYYDLFVELNRTGTRIYNHAMGCKLIEEVVHLIRESMFAKRRLRRAATAAQRPGAVPFRDFPRGWVPSIVNQASARQRPSSYVMRARPRNTYCIKPHDVDNVSLQR
jgi:hypothetical protein